MLLATGLALPAQAGWFGKPSSPSCCRIAEKNIEKTPTRLRIVGSAYAQPLAQDPDIKALLTLHHQLEEASNAHQLKGLLAVYSPGFVSGDNLSLKAVTSLVEDTWKAYPDIAYQSQILEIRLNGDWATVESLDHSSATAQSQNQLPGLTGQLNSESRSLMFLHKIGKNWWVESDRTLYEEARIIYGGSQPGKANQPNLMNSLQGMLSAPDQVFSGESYTARLLLNLPEGTFAISTINRQPLVFPQPKPTENFRTVSPDNSELERVFTANQNYHNEMVSATIGLSRIGRDEQQRPVVELIGLATWVKRVNVLAKEDEATSAPEKDIAAEVVKTSANGKVDVSQIQEPLEKNTSIEAPEPEAAPSATPPGITPNSQPGS